MLETWACYKIVACNCSCHISFSFCLPVGDYVARCIVVEIGLLHTHARNQFAGNCEVIIGSSPPPVRHPVRYKYKDNIGDVGHLVIIVLASFIFNQDKEFRKMRMLASRMGPEYTCGR